jgi:cation diffusion facilitator CzcD-associated flavoprotein CzcO
MYPDQREIQEYLHRVVARHGLRAKIRFGSEVTELRFDDRRNVWRVGLGGSDADEVDVIVSATGPLSRPAVPDIDGLGTFSGTMFHSAQWRHDHDLTGERIAVIGTGASAIQFVPEIAPRADHTTVFQRTAPWVVPKEDRAYRRWEKWAFRRVPLVRRAHRAWIYFRNEALAFDFLGRTDRISRQIRDGVPELIAAAFPDDPETRAELLPDHEPGCKRLLLSNDWYPTLARDDVDLCTAAIESIVAEGIRLVDGTVVEVDTIILGTGFTATEFLAPMKVFGRDGFELSDAWRDGAVTHLGVTVPRFPNFFLLVGPNTGLGHNSIIFMMEAQYRYVSGAIERLRRRGAATIEVRADVAGRSYADVQQRMRSTVWATGCRSWYLRADGRNDTLWPGFTLDYWKRTRRFDPASYIEAEPMGESTP